MNSVLKKYKDFCKCGLRVHISHNKTGASSADRQRLCVFGRDPCHYRLAPLSSYLLTSKVAIRNIVTLFNAGSSVFTSRREWIRCWGQISYQMSATGLLLKVSLFFCHRKVFKVTLLWIVLLSVTVILPARYENLKFIVIFDFDIKCLIHNPRKKIRWFKQTMICVTFTRWIHRNLEAKLL